MLKSQNLSFYYDQKNNFQFPDFEADYKNPCLILGESGKGKTTLLHLLGGLLKPKTGNIFLNNQDISQLKNREMDAFRGKNIGIVFQQTHFVASLSVKENLLLAQYLPNLKQNLQPIQELLNRLDLSDKINQKPHQLSQGEQQRIAIARALLNQPKLILADEPSASLDDKNCQNIIKLLQEEAQAIQATLLIVTHDQRLKNVFKNQIEL